MAGYIEEKFKYFVRYNSLSSYSRQRTKIVEHLKFSESKFWS